MEKSPPNRVREDKGTWRNVAVLKQILDYGIVTS